MRNNYIGRLQVGDEIIEDKVLIKAEILDFYQKLYTESEPWRPVTNFDGLSSLDLEDTTWLELPFEEEEDFTVLRGQGSWS